MAITTVGTEEQQAVSRIANDRKCSRMPADVTCHERCSLIATAAGVQCQPVADRQPRAGLELLIHAIDFAIDRRIHAIAPAGGAGAASLAAGAVALGLAPSRHGATNVMIAARNSRADITHTGLNCVPVLGVF